MTKKDHFLHKLHGTDVFPSTGLVEGIYICLILYDHSIAISKSLNYVTVMSSVWYSALIMASSMGASIHSIVQISLLLPHSFCELNVLDTFYCDDPGP